MPALAAISSFITISSIQMMYYKTLKVYHYINGLVQERRNSSVLAMESKT